MVDFVRGSNPVWYFVNLTGESFDDTYYMYVLENDIPYIPATVYHTETGTPWVNPIEFLANGTLPIDIFFNPELVYRLEFRHNVGPLPPSQADPLIYLVENYIPGAGFEPVAAASSFTENQISNAQFSEVNFAVPYVLTGVVNPDPIQIAPGWELVLVGNGTVTLTQVPLNNALANPTNAPYALRLELSGGWTSLPVLRQRLSQNGMLWASKYVSTSITARIEGVSQQIVARLDASDGQPLGILLSEFLTNDFAEYTGHDLLAATLNADLPPDAWIDYRVLLPTTCDVYITSLQLIASDIDANFEYEQDTIDRQIDHLFHYYKPQLEFKPIPSYLVAWDFPLNPAQVAGGTVAATAIGANKSKYVWDQTIIFQSVDSGIGVTRATNGGITLTQAAAANGQVAIIQYLDQIQARKLLSGEMSIALSGSSSAGISGTVSLWATADVTLPDLNAANYNSIVATIDATGAPATQNGTWTEVLRGNLGDAVFDLETSATEVRFAGWDSSAEAIAATATFFAVVIGFEEMAQNDTVSLYWASLCAGSIATRPAPQTFTEVLGQCQRFYEKSYRTDAYAASITNNNSIVKGQGAYLEVGVTYHMVAQSFSIEFKDEKRTTPTIILYNPVNGTPNQVLGTVFGTGSAAQGTGNLAAALWTASANTKSTYYTLITYNSAVVEGSFAGGGWASGAIRFHYVADARLGIVN